MGWSFVVGVGLFFFLVFGAGGRTSNHLQHWFFGGEMPKYRVKAGMKINLSVLLNSDGSYCNEFSRELSLPLTCIFLIWDSAF